MADKEVEGGARAPRVFTEEEHQAEVNRVAGQVRAEVAAKFADYATLKERAAVADKLEMAGKSETERLRTQLQALETGKLDADLRIADSMITSEIRVLAVQKGFADPNDAVRLIDRSGVKYDEVAGVTGVGPALDALLASKAYLVTASKPQAPNLNAGAKTPANALPPLSEDQKYVAHRLFSDKPEDKAEEAYANQLAKQLKK